MKSLAPTSTPIPIIFNTDSNRAPDDLIVGESKLFPFATVFQRCQRCQRACPSNVNVQEATPTTTCNAARILSSLKSIFKPHRLCTRQAPPDDDEIVGFPLSDHMKQPYFGLLSPHHSINHHHGHSYPHNQHSPEYYQELNNHGPSVYNHPMPRRFGRHCNKYCSVADTILSADKFSQNKYPENPLFNNIEKSLGLQMASKIFNSPLRPTRFLKKYTNVKVTPPIVGTVRKVDSNSVENK